MTSVAKTFPSVLLAACRVQLTRNKVIQGNHFGQLDLLPETVLGRKVHQNKKRKKQKKKARLLAVKSLNPEISYHLKRESSLDEFRWYTLALRSAYAAPSQAVP